jgi:hypothetical protein
MVRLSRAIVVLLILLALNTVCIGTIPAEQIAASDAAALRLWSDTPRKAEIEDTPATPVMVTIEAERYRLTYPLAFTRALPPIQLAELVEAAMGRVEGYLGPFEARLEMLVAGRIVTDDPEFPEDLSIAGVCFVDDDGQIRIVVSLWAADVETFTHELLHARLRDLGMEPPGWFEEGMAHFVEHEDGFHPDLYELLLEEGPLTMDEIKRIKGVTSEEMRLRATAWALVYYLVHHEAHEFSCLAHLGIDDLPDPLKAFAAIKAERERKEAPVKPKLAA